MKISVVMIDGGFRESVHSAESFSVQDFPKNDYEIIWVDYYDTPHPRLIELPDVQVSLLNNPKSSTYHASHCFNHGIKQAQGEIIVLPDADQIVRPDFLSITWSLHERFQDLALYSYRYNEPEPDALQGFEIEELEKKCICSNPRNYGGCLSVRKKWLEEVNGYEMHEVFSGGFHANGYDLYVRLSLLGLAVQWEASLPVYHPWHPYTVVNDPSYKTQFSFVEWRLKSMDYRTFNGIDQNNNRPAEEIPDFLFEQKPRKRGLTERLRVAWQSFKNSS